MFEYRLFGFCVLSTAFSLVPALHGWMNWNWRDISTIYKTGWTLNFLNADIILIKRYMFLVSVNPTLSINLGGGRLTSSA